LSFCDFSGHHVMNIEPSDYHSQMKWRWSFVRVQLTDILVTIMHGLTEYGSYRMPLTVQLRWYITLTPYTFAHELISMLLEEISNNLLVKSNLIGCCNKMIGY